MEKHFVTFYSPSTFVAETTTKEIGSWDIDKAAKMSEDISERYGAQPYAFQFTTRGRNDDELDSKVINESGYYYLGGEVLTVEEVIAENNPRNGTLIRNMQAKNFKQIVRSNNSWQWCQPLNPKDVVLSIPATARQE